VADPNLSDETWLVCRGRVRLVTDGTVRCPVARRRMPVTACSGCRYLETRAGERDDDWCSSGDVSPPPR
jgi:hypothetical protein